MQVNLEHLRHAEDRMKVSLAGALNSTLVLLAVMLLILLFGIVLAKR
jgi:hypothetical protein